MSTTAALSAEARLAALGLTLPPVKQSSGAYRTWVRSGDLLLLAGHGPVRPGAAPIRGALGRALGTAEGAAAARLATLGLLSTIRDALGSLDRVAQVLRLRAALNATADFTDHIAVADAASTLLVEVFGERGRHVRSALGHSSLPLGVALSLELDLRIDTSTDDVSADGQTKPPRPARCSPDMP